MWDDGDLGSVIVHLIGGVVAFIACMLHGSRTGSFMAWGVVTVVILSKLGSFEEMYGSYFRNFIGKMDIY